MSLRDAIKEQHDAAEAHPFTALTLSGSITPEKYAEHLANHYVVFSAIEGRMRNTGLFNDMPDIFRAERILADAQELTSKAQPIHSATVRCVNRIAEIDDRQLMAYVYVYHFADMFGGQMIKSKVPGSSSRFVFEDRSGLIAKVRPMLGDDLADEAKRAFAFTLDLFDELVDTPT